jgi:hypothetical protein
MADAGLFIGWGAPVRGREAKGLEVFAEAITYYERLRDEGVIERFDTAILEPHGGDLNGFFLLHGSKESLAALRVHDDFVRLMARAGLIVEGLGVTGVALGDGLGAQIGMYQEGISELA